MIVTRRPVVLPSTPQRVFGTNGCGLFHEPYTVTAGREVETTIRRVYTPGGFRVRRLRLHFVNLYALTGPTTSFETAAGNAITWRAAVRIFAPGETAERQVFWSANPSFTQASGAYDLTGSDEIDVVCPPNTEILVCVEATNTVGQTRVAGYRPAGTADHNKRSRRATTANYVTGPFSAMPLTEGDWFGEPGGVFCPLITAESMDGRRVSVMFNGDSIGRGADDNNDGFGNTGFLERAAWQLGWAFANGNVPGSNLQWSSEGDSRMACRRYLFGPYATMIAHQGGHNSAYGDAAVWTTVQGQLVATWNYFNTWAGGPRCIQTVVGPATDSTDGWATLANQSDIGGACRTSMRAFQRSRPPQIINVVDVAPDLGALSDERLFRPGETDDGSHPGPAPHERAALTLRRALARMAM